MKRLSSIVTIVAGLCFALLFSVTCKKEYSYEGGRQAKYTFVGAPDTCTAVETGKPYTMGVPADSSNYAVVYIKVISTGTAEITTGEVDGLTFSTGKLELTTITPDSLNFGIVLHVQGTPKDTGTFTVGIPGTPGCSFTLTVVPPPLAGYTLSGAPNDCSNPVKQGSFTQGVPMTTDNLVTITVEVAAAGPYHISTNQVNGISFVASGTFPSTGAQQVDLHASGTPITAELSHFLLSADGSECDFYIGISNPDPIATYVLQSSPENGIDYCAPGSVQGNYTAGTPLSSGNTLTVNAYITAVGNYTISTTRVNGIMFSASGAFTSTGPQDVVLRGSGTPEAVGTYILYPQIVGPAPLGGSLCGLAVEVK